MILKTQKGQDLVKHLARPIVAQIAPEDLEDFDDLAEGYFADPRLESDETLGAGFDLVPDLVIVLAFVATALDHLSVKKGATNSWWERLSGALRQKPAESWSRPVETPRFTKDEVQRALSAAREALGHRQNESIAEREMLQQIARILCSLLLGRPRVGILFLGANPAGSTTLGLARELRQVATAIREAPFRDRLLLTSELAVRVDDLQRTLLSYKPQVVHFSGHGDRSNAILLEGEDGSAHAVSPESLSRLFQVFAGQLRCVVLNACFSEEQAHAIAAHADGVVGMSTEISDGAAISFSRAFYRALAYGESLQLAFDLGCSQIDLDGFRREADIPRLIALRADPREIALVLTRTEAHPVLP
jgi:hypothetical protein